MRIVGLRERPNMQKFENFHFRFLRPNFFGLFPKKSVQNMKIYWIIMLSCKTVYEKNFYLAVLYNFLPNCEKNTKSIFTFFVWFLSFDHMLSYNFFQNQLLEFIIRACCKYEVSRKSYGEWYSYSKNFAFVLTLKIRYKI